MCIRLNSERSALTKVFASSAIRSRLCHSSCNSSVEIEEKWTLTWCYSKRSKTKTTRPKLMILVSLFIWKDTLYDGPSHFVILSSEVPHSVFFGATLYRVFGATKSLKREISGLRSRPKRQNIYIDFEIQNSYGNGQRMLKWWSMEPK